MKACFGTRVVIGSESLLPITRTDLCSVSGVCPPDCRVMVFYHPRRRLFRTQPRCFCCRKILRDRRSRALDASKGIAGEALAHVPRTDASCARACVPYAKAVKCACGLPGERSLSPGLADRPSRRRGRAQNGLARRLRHRRLTWDPTRSHARRSTLRKGDASDATLRRRAGTAPGSWSSPLGGHTESGTPSASRRAFRRWGHR